MLPTPATADPTICVDITDLLLYARRNSAVSGIQRVIIRTISQFVNEHGLGRVDLIAFDPKSETFVRTSSDFFGGPYEYDQDLFCAYFKLKKESTSEGKVDLKEYLDSRYGDGLRYSFHQARLPLINVVSRGRSFAKRNIIEARFKLPSLETADVSNVQWREANFSETDRIYVLGATWDFPKFGATLSAMKRKFGFRVYHLVYDLVPLVVPEHVDLGSSIRFEAWFRELLDTTDVLLAISEATARDIGRFANLIGRQAPSVRTVLLAHEFQLPPPLNERQRQIRVFNDRNLQLSSHATSRALAATLEPYALVVGSIDSRKNILRLVRVWKHLLQTHGTSVPTLILAGKSGGYVDDLWSLLNTTGYLDGKVRFIKTPNDSEIAFLYANCLFSICISYYEGWGLPIGESMWLGRPVMASRSSSIPEVGLDLIDYCDPTDDEEIGSQLKRLIFDTEHREKRVAALASAKLRTWAEVVGQMWRELNT
jgi:glycosyltransferase involved in cell wall biosynthesis